MSININKINWEKYKEELIQALSNERIWELGCTDEYNPHTENIARIENEISWLYAGRYEEIVKLHGLEYFIDYDTDNKRS